ncbi:MAG: hypothetical protein ABR569_11600 [Gaiellaceae bacterium]
MRAFSARRALRLPVRAGDIKLGRPVDVLLDRIEWRVLGFEVHCGDGATRFLPLSAARVGDTEIATGSALTLLEDVDHYRTRSRSLRALLGTAVTGGLLRDLLVDRDGAVSELVAGQEDAA